MTIRKKKTKKEGPDYSRNESFENLETVQKMALNRKGKDDEIVPDISIFLKAEELKGKLCGLYTEKEKIKLQINKMGSVKVDGKDLMLRVGEEIAADNDNDRITEDIEYTGEIDSGYNTDK